MIIDFSIASITFIFIFAPSKHLTVAFGPFPHATIIIGTMRKLFKFSTITSWIFLFISIVTSSINAVLFFYIIYYIQSYYYKLHHRTHGAHITFYGVQVQIWFRVYMTRSEFLQMRMLIVKVLYSLLLNILVAYFSNLALHTFLLLLYVGKANGMKLFIWCLRDQM